MGKSSKNWSVPEIAAERTKLSSVADKAARSIMKPVMYLFQCYQATECPEGTYPKKWPTTAKNNISSKFLTGFRLTFSVCRQIHYQQARICPNLLPISLHIRIWNGSREKREMKERASAQKS